MWITTKLSSFSHIKPHAKYNLPIFELCIDTKYVYKATQMKTSLSVGKAVTLYIQQLFHRSNIQTTALRFSRCVFNLMEKKPQQQLIKQRTVCFASVIFSWTAPCRWRYTACSSVFFGGWFWVMVEYSDIRTLVLDFKNNLVCGRYLEKCSCNLAGSRPCCVLCSAGRKRRAKPAVGKAKCVVVVFLLTSTTRMKPKH